jgi:4-hydroxybenzoate polyprenyltransferase
LGLLVLGVFALSCSSNVTGGLGLAMAAFIVVGHVLHRPRALAVIQPAICRLLFYLMGASVGVIGITGQSIWCGLALAIYVVGVSYLPHQRDATGPQRHWPMLLMGVPIFLALIMDDNGSRQAGLLLSAVLALWTARCLRPALWSAEQDFPRAVTGLVAGIALVDLLAVADGPKAVSAVFIALFLAVRGLQELAARR